MATTGILLSTPAMASTTHKVTGNKAVSHTAKVVVRKYRSKSSKKRLYTLKSAGHGRYTMKAKYYVHSFTKFTLQRTAKISGKTYYEVKSPAGYTGWIWSGYLGNPTTYYNFSKITAVRLTVKASATNNFYNHVPGGDYGSGTLTHYGKNYRNKTMTVTGEAKKVYKTPYYRLSYNGKNFGWIYGGSLQSVATSKLTTYTQSGVALQAFNKNNYKTVNNTNLFVTAPKTYGTAPSYPSMSTSPNTIQYKKGTGTTTFTTDVYLPSSYHTSGDIGSAQSLVMDGNTAYVMYLIPSTANTTNEKGFVIKYNLAELRTLVKSSKDYAILSRAFYNQRVQKTLTASQQKALACMTIGPTFATGHGQSMALNAKTKQIWFIGKSGKGTDTSNLQELNKTTLTPDKKINFVLGQNQNMPKNLTFDSNGNLYAFVENQSASLAAIGSVKIYKGTINANHTVTFNLVMQGLTHAPGTYGQSIAVNPVNQRLYFVADGSISSVPISKLGSLTASDVRGENFKTVNASGKETATREFEGLAFDQNGGGYLLTNDGVEIMKASNSNF